MPGLDHGTKDPLVGLRLTGVGFALIPDCSAHRITDERGDHAIPIHVGPVGPDRGEPARVLTKLRGDGLVLFDLESGLDLLDGGGASLDARGFLGVEVLRIRNVGIHALRTPGLGARAADGSVDHADRLLDVGAQFAGEEKSGRGEALDGIRSGEFPGTLHVIGGLGLGRAGDGEDAEAGVGGAGLGIRGGGGVLDDPIHVRLTGTDPDFADDDVMGGEDFFARAHDEVLALFGRLEAGEGRGPLAVIAGGGGRFDGAELDADLRARMGLAEDGGVTGLEDGMVGEQGDELQLSGRNERGAAKHEECEAG